MQHTERIQEILSYWFGSFFEEEFPPRFISDKWYNFNPATDESIRQQFSGDVEAALAGQYDSWANCREGRLALLILLDQFTRHIYRNTPQAFTGDPKALALVKAPEHKQYFEELNLCQKIFYFGALEHSERLEDQEEHMKIYMDLLPNLSEQSKEKLEYYLYWFKVHHDVILKFGRFPWRNEILQRESTPEELEYLANAPDFGQK